MQNILSNELDRIEDKAWQLRRVELTPEALRKLQEGSTKICESLGHQDALTKSGVGIDVIAFFAIAAARYEIDLWDSPEGAVSLVASAAELVGVWAGVTNGPDADAIKAIGARTAAYARHTANREKSDAIKSWYRDNRGEYPSMDAAAEAAAVIMDVAFRTARKHIGAAAKDDKEQGA